MTEKRSRLRATFDRAALLYDEARPGYPESVFGDVVALSGIPPGGRVLEIGCGTGQATVPFARRSYRILCVELGENLAAVARKNLAAYPWTEVRTGAFEDWPVEKEAFDLVVSAEAFYWLDRPVVYRKATQALRPGGALALLWNRHVQSEESAGFFEAVQEVYRREAPELADTTALPGYDDVRGRMDDIQETGLFGEPTVRKHLWYAEYDAPGYVRLLETYSGHINLEDATREHLFRDIAELIDTEYGGRIVKGYVTVLYVARKERPGS